jgi:hypothetical protein
LKTLTLAYANESNQIPKESINQIIDEEREKNRKLLSEIKAIRQHSSR